MCFNWQSPIKFEQDQESGCLKAVDNLPGDIVCYFIPKSTDIITLGFFSAEKKFFYRKHAIVDTKEDFFKPEEVFLYSVIDEPLHYQIESTSAQKKEDCHKGKQL